MTVYDALFILWFLGSLVALIGSLILAITRGRKAAKNVLLTTAVAGLAYLSTVALSDVTARQRIIETGHEFCFDEMCFAVAGARTENQLGPYIPTSARDNVLYIIDVRVTSHSLGRAQSEGGLRARLYQNGKFFSVAEAAQRAYDKQYGKTPALTEKINPGESVVCTVVFELPRTLASPGLTLDHGFTPGYFVIGESPFFHEPDIFQLKPIPA